MTFTQAALDAQADFDTSAVGKVYRRAMCGYFAQLLTAPERASFGHMLTSLAARVAFDGCTPAAYALRSLARANPDAHWARGV